MVRCETIGRATLYLGDCATILPTLQRVDLVCTDPPYGIGEAAGKAKTRGKLAIAKDYGNDDWDNAPVAPEVMAMVRAAGQWQIIFGGNYYALPPCKGPLVWDKENGENDFADGELAWNNLGTALRIKRHRWHGMIRKGGEDRHHPTQKPLALMRWCLGFVPDAKTVLDPFMGSGTTGVACVKLGRRFVGIEIDDGYFDIACDRIAKAYAQPDMFVERAPEPIQQPLFNPEAA